MSYTIVPNTALGMGVILIVTLACGSVLQVPCHNHATADHVGKSYKSNPKVADMAVSFANRSNNS